MSSPEFGTGSGIKGILSRGALGLLNTGNTSVKQKKEGGRRKTKRRRKSNKKKRELNKKKRRQTRGKKTREKN